MKDNKQTIVEMAEYIAYKNFVANMSDSYSVTLSEQTALKEEVADFLEKNNLDFNHGNIKYKDTGKQVLREGIGIEEIMDNIKKRENKKPRI